VQVIQYAGRVLQLAQTLFDQNLEPAFLDLLAKASSNIREHGDGRRIYEKFVKPAIVDREHLGAHFAVSSLFENYPDKTRIYKFTFEQERREMLKAGKARLLIGLSKITFDTTRAADIFSYAAMHRGDYDINCGVRYFRGAEDFQNLLNELSDAFKKENFELVTRLMDKCFGETHYSLKSLFRDEQRKILNQILASTGQDLENRYRQIADQFSPLMRFLKDIGAPLPSAIKTAAVFILNAELRRQFESDEPDPARIRALLEEAQAGNVELHKDQLAYVIKKNIDQRLEHLTRVSDDVQQLARTAELAEIIRTTGIEVNLWKTQNLFFKLLNEVAPERLQQSRSGDKLPKEWPQHFAKLGDQLGFKVSGLNE
jgi:hypothetical protein